MTASLAPLSPHAGPGLTLQAVEWAAQHDWFIRAIPLSIPGKWAALCEEVCTIDPHRLDTVAALTLDGYAVESRNDGPGFVAYQTFAFTSLPALRAWAGY